MTLSVKVEAVGDAGLVANSSNKILGDLRGRELLCGVVELGNC